MERFLETCESNRTGSEPQLFRTSGENRIVDGAAPACLAGIPDVKTAGRAKDSPRRSGKGLAGQAVLALPRAHGCPCARLPGLGGVTLLMVTAALGCVPSLRAAARRPRIWEWSSSPPSLENQEPPRLSPWTRAEAFLILPTTSALKVPSTAGPAHVRRPARRGGLPRPAGREAASPVPGPGVRSVEDRQVPRARRAGVRGGPGNRTQPGRSSSGPDTCDHGIQCGHRLLATRL
jgi:hypothetical protein